MANLINTDSMTTNLVEAANTLGNAAGVSFHTNTREYLSESLNQSLDYNVQTDTDDGGTSSSILNDPLIIDGKDMRADNPIFTLIRHNYGLYDSGEVDLYNQIYRFGIFDPARVTSTFKEVLFFTKPDLQIRNQGNPLSSIASDDRLCDGLRNLPFWKEMYNQYPNIIKSLQYSYSKDSSANPFNNLLQNMVTSSIEIPSAQAESIETASNMYGVNLTYRGSSEASDDSFDFSLEFKDTKYLEVYRFFKAYDDYEVLKHHGIVKPWIGYIEQKILHDQFCIYKFLLDDDMETIRYYAKYYGVYPTSVPRDTFANTDFNSGISYSVSFKCAFFEDMTPEILYDFNYLSKDLYNAAPYQIDNYNAALDRVDTRPATAAKVVRWKSNLSPNGFVYKLKWRGGAKF